MVRPTTRILFALVLLLARCASFERPDRPQDLPMHSADHPFFDLHWRLDRSDGVVSAVGLVEAARVTGIGWVIVELKGLDSQGGVVSHGYGRTLAGPLDRGDTQPFRVRMRETGREERFDLTVWAYGWRNDGDSGRDD
jgi:hypothetical protein